MQRIQPDFPKWLIWIPMIFGWILYANTAANGFAWDDSIVIVENNRVQQGLSGIPSHFVRHTSDLLQDKYGYRPVTLISFTLDYSLFGLRPGPFHLVNAFLFGLCCLLLYQFIRIQFPGTSRWIAWWTAMLFASLPVHTEAVANIKSRDELLAFLFGFCALILFQKGLEESRIRKTITQWTLALLFFVLAFLSRENAAGFALVWMLQAVITPGISIRKRFLPFILTAMSAVIVMVVFHYSASSTVDREITAGAGFVQEERILGNSLFFSDFWSDILPYSFRLIWEYLRLNLVGFPLRYYYGYNTIPVNGMRDPLAWAGLLMACLLFFAAWKSRKKIPEFGFGVAFFFITLFLYLQIVRRLDDSMAERFAFTPSAGFSLALVSAMVYLMQRRTEFLNKTNTAMHFVFAVPCLVFSFMTVQRNRVWKDNASLFKSDMPKLETCARAHYYYAGSLATQWENNRGNAAARDAAIQHYRKAISLSEHVYHARIELAQVLMNAGRTDEAVQVLEEAVRKFEGEGRAWFWLGYGKYFQKRYGDAVTYLEKARRMSPKRLDTSFWLSWAYYMNDRKEDAITVAREAISREPERVQYHDALSDFLLGSGREEEGFRELREVIRLSPGKPDPYRKLLLRYQEKGDTAMVRATYQEALSKGIRL